MKNYDLCDVCDHTPAFCYCSSTGLSRAQIEHAKTRILYHMNERLAEDYLNPVDEVVEKIAKRIDEEYLGDE